MKPLTEMTLDEYAALGRERMRHIRIPSPRPPCKGEACTGCMELECRSSAGLREMMRAAGLRVPTLSGALE